MFEKLKKFIKEKTSETFDYVFEKPKTEKGDSYYQQARGKDFHSSIESDSIIQKKILPKFFHFFYCSIVLSVRISRVAAVEGNRFLLK